MPGVAELQLAVTLGMSLLADLGGLGVPGGPDGFGGVCGHAGVPGWLAGG